MTFSASNFHKCKRFLVCIFPWLNLALSVCYYHVTYAFWNEFRLYNYLNVKELLARNMRNIWSLSDSNGIWTHNHLVLKQTKWLWVWIPLLPFIASFQMQPVEFNHSWINQQECFFFTPLKVFWYFQGVKREHLEGEVNVYEKFILHRV